MVGHLERNGTISVTSDSSLSYVVLHSLAAKARGQRSSLSIIVQSDLEILIIENMAESFAQNLDLGMGFKGGDMVQGSVGRARPKD